MRFFRTSTILHADKDFYSILGVEDDAAQADIKRAFLMKAKQFHPDVNPSKEASKIFSDLNEAYETLKEEDTRKMYDATGMSANE